MLILNRISTSPSPSFFNPSYLWKLGVYLDKALITPLTTTFTTPYYFTRTATLKVYDSSTGKYI